MSQRKRSDTIGASNMEYFNTFCFDVCNVVFETMADLGTKKIRRITLPDQTFHKTRTPESVERRFLAK